MSWKLLRPVALIATVAIAGTSGCASERDPINRVQANALAKSFFVGASLSDTRDDPEFWTQATIIDVPYGASQDGLFASTYTQEVARIKWQITEDLLLGRLTYQRIEDSDGKGAGAADNDGQIVVAYAITSHFDIRHAYNSSTGEELNVIEENTTDRPWYEREYFRVDWSENLNTSAYDFDTLSLLGIFGGVEYTSLAYYVNDPSDADAPFFDVGKGYFDVTNKAFAAPGMIDLSHLGWGIDAFPACMLPNDLLGGSEPVGNCNPTELTIRQAFRKVEDTDYEPLDWDGYRFQAYGGFYVNRYGYSRKYGIVDDRWHRFLTRYNVYERSHYYEDPASMTGEIECYTPETLHQDEDPHLDSNSDGTEDRCWYVTVKLAQENGMCSAEEDAQACYDKANPTYGGSHCDIFKQRCTLPYRQRQPRRLAWYYTTKSDPTFFESTEWATHDHDVGMRHAMMTAKYAECMATAAVTDDLAGLRANCVAQNPVYFGQMDDHLEAEQLAKEVDDCRHGLSHPDAGAVNSDQREEYCVALADSEAAERGGSTRTLDAGIVALARQPEQLVLCHSPVEWNDPTICAPTEERLPAGMTAEQCYNAEQDKDLETLAVCNQARNARRGDLRYHLVNVFTEPASPSPWGIYTDAEDPLTGETFSAAINVWAWVNELWAQQVVDRFQYIKGELSTEDITEGEYVRAWAQAAEAASGGGVAPKVTRAQIDKKLAQFAEVDTQYMKDLQLEKGLANQIREAREELREVRASVDASSTMAPIYEARRKQVVGSLTEAELIDPMMQDLAGGTSLPTAYVSEQSSIMQAQNPLFRRQINNFMQQALAERGTCILNEAPAPMAVTGLADIMEEKFAHACAVTDGNGGCVRQYGKFGTGGNICENPNDSSTCVEDPIAESGPTPEQKDFQAKRAQVMVDYIAQRAQYAVIVHEMGHSVGMRHNFVSSSDAYNYRPQYWQLRTDDGNVTANCLDYTDDGSNCVGPRYFDPVDQNERDNLIWMWMQSSVMDYAGEYTQDFLGLAGWDYAAHRMFYGEAVATFSDDTYRVGQNRAFGMLQKEDNFGGILGIQPTYANQDIHYTEYQGYYDLIQNCQVVPTEAYKPASWDESTKGTWHPVLDGLIVANKSGEYTKCEQQKVDYVPWQNLRIPTSSEAGSSFARSGPAVDKRGRVRVPYGFATDRWADLGNASVYRHDNGADVYEIFNWLATQSELQHIFDNYRRGRQTFSVSSAAHRTLGRYNEKIRDGAKGLGLLSNYYRDLFTETGASYTALWAYAVKSFFPENVLASAMVFDHFARTMARPEAGEHYIGDDGILRSQEDASTLFSEMTAVTIPNGATSYAGETAFGNVSMGGKLVENRLCETCGDYDSEYTMNAGSYYDKVFAPYLMTESVDNFISDSRGDFVDGRYRAVSLADLFPEGYRRWLANNLTGDDFIKGPRLAATASGNVLLDADNYPAQPIGWTTWWGDEVTSCFPASGTFICGTPGGDPNDFEPLMPDGTRVVDPQINYEQQKFLIAQTMLWLPEDQRQHWVDMMRLWQYGYDSDPLLDNYIMFHDPIGKTWIARAYGKETIFGKEVHKGIAARVLEWANELLEQGYEVTPVDYNSDGEADWYEVVRDTDGNPIVKFDPGMVWLNDIGQPGSPPDDCNETDNSGCTCEDNRACSLLKRYMSVPQYLWQAMSDFGYADPEQKGVYE